MARTARRTMAAVAALGTTLPLSGCMFANPITTQGPYAASDGIRVEVADGVAVENLMVLTEEEGSEGQVFGAVVNRSREDVEVSLTLGEGGEETPVEVGAGESVNLQDEGITVQSVQAPPGATLPSTVSTAGAGAIDVSVPVLDGTIPPYDEYLGGA